MSDSVSSRIPTQDAAEDSHILEVADHGVDPRPLSTFSGSSVGAASHSMHTPSGRSPRPRRRRGRHIDRSRFRLRDVVVYCGIPILVVVLVRVFVIGLYVIPSGSMMDTIEIGDRVVTSRLSARPSSLRHGDVVVFRDPAHWLSDETTSSSLGGNYLIKRLIGLPGDLVACKGGGSPVTINGVAVDESSYIRPGVEPSSFSFSVKVTAGHVFVMGDNRANSADSRYHQNDGDDGLVPMSDIVGVGVAIYWPISRMSGLDSHHEVFADVPNGTVG